MIDKESGDIICSFDELHETQAVEMVMLRANRKREHVEGKNKEGGATLKYGLKKTKDGFAPASVSHVPVFCLSADTESVKRLLYGCSATGELTNEEKDILLNLLDTLHAEAERMDDILVEEGESYGGRGGARGGALAAEEYLLKIPIEEVPVTQRIRRTIHILEELRSRLADRVFERS